jgi:mRNA interferase HigB
MRVVGTKRIRDFCAQQADAAGDALSWLAEAKAASWRTPHDVRARYPSASFVGKHVVFNLRGNRYRLDVKISYSAQIVSIVRAGTHAEYDRWTFSD